MPACERSSIGVAGAIVALAIAGAWMAFLSSGREASPVQLLETLNDAKAAGDSLAQQEAEAEAKPDPIERIDPKHMKRTFPMEPHEEYVESVIGSEGILGMANSREFRAANRAGREALVERWIRQNAMRRFRELSARDRDRAVRLLARQLDNLLSEKDFEPDRLRVEPR
jgi:hypothetical protein